jgi:DNA-binding transcriptional ArsR family regulator
MKTVKKKKSPSGLEVMKKNAAKAEAMLKLLANSKRLMILCHLVKGAKSVGELSEIVGLSQSALSQHLAKMHAVKIIGRNKKGKMVYYHIANYEVEAILSTLYLIYCKD